jgi:DHA1 family bicyclomycin/chloramphenicol resistance-like MFS transporter
MQAPSPSRLFSFALALSALITPLAVHLFFPVIPLVKAELALSDAEAQLTFSIALFTMAFATLVYGSLSDRFGRRPVLLSGLALFLVGSAVARNHRAVSADGRDFNRSAPRSL